MSFAKCAACTLFTFTIAKNRCPDATTSECWLYNEASAASTEKINKIFNDDSGNGKKTKRDKKRGKGNDNE